MKKVFFTLFAAAMVVLTGCSKDDKSSDTTDPKPGSESKIVNINGVDFKFVLVKAGTFQMGSPATEHASQASYETQHWVRISKDYYICETEITKNQWWAVMGSNPNDATPLTEAEKNQARNLVSWLEICGGTNGTITVAPDQAFLSKINAFNKGVFNLPTEAQWEYAARGGHKITTYMKYAGTNNDSDFGNYAWFKENSSDRTVGKKLPNQLGIYDMAGNLLEACLDKASKTYGYKINSGNSVSQPVIDPCINDNTTAYIARGGHYLGEKELLRCAARENSTIAAKNGVNGFRLIMVL